MAPLARICNPCHLHDSPAGGPISSKGTDYKSAPASFASPAGVPCSCKGTDYIPIIIGTAPASFASSATLPCKIIFRSYNKIIPGAVFIEI
jgi:hypothetical protein